MLFLAKVKQLYWLKNSGLGNVDFLTQRAGWQKVIIS